MTEIASPSDTRNRANRVFGTSPADVVKAVEAARASVTGGEGRAAILTPDERAANAADRRASPEAVDKALGKDPATTVAVVEEAVSLLEQRSEGGDGETPAEEKPAEPTPREGRLLGEIRQRERKLVEERARFKRERAEFDDLRRRYDAAIQQANDVLSMSKSDPFGFFEKFHGIKREAFGVANRGQDPGASVAAAQQSAEVAQLRRQLEERDQRERAREAEDSRQQILNAFVDRAAKGAATWPMAAKLGRERLLRLGESIALAARERHVTLQDEEILDRIEEELSEIVALGNPKSSASGGAPKDSGTARPQGQSGAPALTSQGSGEGDNTKKKLPSMKRDDRIAEGVAALERFRAQSQRR